MARHKTILVTGASGYIGTHVCIELLSEAYSVIALDNLSRSSRESLHCAEQIAGRPIPFYQADVRDRQAIEAVLRLHRVDAAIHLASVHPDAQPATKPLGFFDNNVGGTLTLLQALGTAGVKTFVCGLPVEGVDEAEHAVALSDSTLAANLTSYSRSKRMVEQILQDLAHADPGCAIGTLSHFDPAGCHPAWRMAASAFFDSAAEAQTVAGRYDGGQLSLASEVNEVIHVMDLARGYVAVLTELFRSQRSFALTLGEGIRLGHCGAGHPWNKAAGTKHDMLVA